MNTRFFIYKAIYAGLFVALTAPLSLKGDDSPRYGVGASIVNPSGEFGGLGFAGAFTGQWNLNDNMAVRGKAEFVFFGSTDWGCYGSTSTTGIVGMADFVYTFDSHDEGWYVFAGAGLVNRSYSTEWNFLGYKDKTTTSSIGPAITGGGGFNFSRSFGVEAAFVNSPGSVTGNGVGYPTFGYLQASAKWRF
jgi:hypothetical protein